MFVRQAREKDSKQCAEWYSLMPSCSLDTIRFPETYTLCAFKKNKIIAFLIVQVCGKTQVLCRLISNPESSDLEKATASRDLVKQVISFGYINELPEILFMGDVLKTNRIAEHVFKKIEYSDQNIFEEDIYPVYRLRLGDLE